MQSNVIRAVVADDEELNLEILSKTIMSAGYEVSSFDDGDDALQYIKANPENVDIVILDKMMPRMSGIEVIKQLKSHPILKNIPVILQTGDVGVAQLKEGLDVGAYYYLSKPFDPSMLVSLVNAATRDCVKVHNTLKQLKKEKPITSLLKSGVFEIRTIEDAYKLTAALASHAIKPEEVNLGVGGLIVNAIEHGNLNIGYETKNTLLKNNMLQDEINKRLNMSENVNKYVKVIFENLGNKIHLLIEDCGGGFDWKRYMNFDPIRLTDLNGRGIASANLMHLDIMYSGSGNKVKCQFDVDAKILRL